MNKDLMMKAAVQFKGVWPSENASHLGTTSDDWNGGEDIFGSIRAYRRDTHALVGGEFDGYAPRLCDNAWQMLCTREQFEDFVESLFDGAPDDATHYSPEDENYEQAWWKKDGDEMLCISEEGYIYTWENGWFSAAAKLIPRPAKKTQSEAPYMPKVGEECECKCTAKGKEIDWFVCCPKYISKYTVVTTSNDFAGEFIAHPDTMQFRPIRTEREKFIERCAADYLDRVGSDAVNEKWFGRIFGAMYDSGCRYLQS